MASYFLRNVDPFAKACLWTADEGLDIYFPRGSNMDDLWRILFNLVYRLGNLYDRLYEIVDIGMWSLVTPYISDVEWQYIGGIVGRMVTEVLYPDQYGDIEIVYPDE